MKIALIGCGNMGSAIYKGLLKIYPAKDIYVCDRIPRRGIKNMSGNTDETLRIGDVIILAVKPQQFNELAASLKVDIGEKLIISIMAGISISKIKKLTGAKKVIRSMPNLAASVGRSLTGWVACKGVKRADKLLIAKIFSSCGASVELTNENMINALTALSGSGPAYFFYLTELLQKKAEKFGFKADQAKLIAEKTLAGSAGLIGLNLKDAAEWRKSVTSKRGTTETAIKYMKKRNLERIFNGALDKAKKRAEELNNAQN